ERRALLRPAAAPRLRIEPEILGYRVVASELVARMETQPHEGQARRQPPADEQVRAVGEEGLDGVTEAAVHDRDVRHQPRIATARIADAAVDADAEPVAETGTEEDLRGAVEGSAGPAASLPVAALPGVARPEGDELPDKAEPAPHAHHA